MIQPSDDTLPVFKDGGSKTADRGIFLDNDRLRMREANDSQKLANNGRCWRNEQMSCHGSREEEMCDHFKTLS